MKTFIEHFLQPSTRMVAFVGAGISRESPASFPLSYEIIEVILNSVLEQTDLSPILAENLMNSLKETALPLEYFSQIAVHVFGREFVRLFPSFVHPQARPNNFHRLLAIAASHGLLEAIFTPNFDEFIEDAMKSLGMSQSKTPQPSSNNKPTPNRFPVGYYRVISSDEDFKSLESLRDFTTTHKPGDTIPIFKLHGTLSAPESILVSIESYQSWFLMDRRSFMANFVSQRPCIWFFAGYSGRDEIFGWLHPPAYTVGHESPVFSKVYWLLKKESSVVAPEVDTFLKKHSAITIVGTAEDLACTALTALGETSQKESFSLHGNEYKLLSDWFMQKSRMKLYNFAAALCLFLGRYFDAIEIVRTGFHATGNLLDHKEELTSYIIGLFYISIAKAELGDPEGAAADIERGIHDWQAYKAEIVAGELSEADWKYIEGRMKFWQGFTFHLRNRSITDQIAAWELMKEAGETLESWHDSQGFRRNFESSPEYAELHWRKGLFLLNGGDIELSKRCFWRILDVDFFEQLHMMRTKHLFGLALVAEAEAQKAKCYPYGDFTMQNHLKAALSLGEAALESVRTTYQVDILGDILMLLARVTEELGQEKDALAYYQRAAKQFKYVCRDSLKQNLAMTKVEELSNRRAC